MTANVCNAVVAQNVFCMNIFIHLNNLGILWISTFYFMFASKLNCTFFPVLVIIQRCLLLSICIIIQNKSWKTLKIFYCQNRIFLYSTNSQQILWQQRHLIWLFINLIIDYEFTETQHSFIRIKPSIFVQSSLNHTYDFFFFINTVNKTDSLLS